MTRKSKKEIQNQSQSGRSMVEMLGVLAIIAILSIGGIVGYKLAMNYYQADQIANEINLIRNDLKIKYALGNEELLLGDPYDDTPADENYSGHLSTQYDRYPVDYDCIRKDKAEFYNCRETDAYYIKVGNVSKGVCKPLTTLVSAMDGLMYIEINKKVYKEDDLCDEANEIYIQFDAEEVNGNYDSGRPEDWCAKDEDCEEPQVCDKENNTCVECTENAHCTSNICRKDHTCGECTKDSDCVNPRPICDTEAATCIGCVGDDECQKANMNKPVCDMGTGACCDDLLMTWNGSECVCPEDYKKSETSSGKAVCLPYCEQEVGVVLLIDRSASTIRDPIDADSNNKYEAKINRALNALTIPEKLKIAVYLDDGTSEEIVRNPLSYGTYSAETIKNTIHNYQVRLVPAGTTFTPALKDIQSNICTGQEKLLIVMWTDAALDTAIGINSQDTEILRRIKNNECPGSKFYLIGPSNFFSSITDAFFSIDSLPESYTGILNEVIQQEGCVKRE